MRSQLLIKDPAVIRHDAQGRPVYRQRCVPEGLHTAAQLRAMRLSEAGLQPVAWLYCRIGHRECPLYDRTQARPIRELTERQRRALAAGRALAHTVPCLRCSTARVSVWWELHYCPPCWQILRDEQHAAHQRMLAADRAAAAEWAGGVLDDPASVFIDFETVGLPEYGDAFACEFTAIDRAGNRLLDTLINPGVPIPESATRVHGITDEMVADAPTFAEILPQLTETLSGRRVIIYNAKFDTTILELELDRYYRAAEPDSDLDETAPHPAVAGWMSQHVAAECAMEKYAQWFGEWNPRTGRYIRQALNGGHRAYGDCLALRDRVAAMRSQESADIGSGGATATSIREREML